MVRSFPVGPERSHHAGADSYRPGNHREATIESPRSRVAAPGSAPLGLATDDRADGKAGSPWVILGSVVGKMTGPCLPCFLLSDFALRVHPLPSGCVVKNSFFSSAKICQRHIHCENAGLLATRPVVIGNSRLRRVSSCGDEPAGNHLARRAVTCYPNSSGRGCCFTRDHHGPS